MIGDGEETLCAVLLGNAATCERAADLAQSSRVCPYVATYTASDRLVVGVFALPAHKRWWIEYPQEHPELLGLERLVVHVTDEIRASSPWSRGEVAPVLEIAPCETDCGACPHYAVRCEGCPVTVHYRPRGHDIGQRD
jgi:hypothetical protein